MINLIAPINNLGYGVAGYNITKALSQTGNVALYPIAPPEFTDDIIENAIANQQRLNLSSPCIKLWHQNDLSLRIGKGMHIGFPVFELNEFNELEKCSMRHCDKLFCCSKWAKEVIVNSLQCNPKNVCVVPLGVDAELFSPQSSGRQTTVFFNCGKWETRKGHDLLVEMFNGAFEHNDDVELWMMCDNPFLGERNSQWINLYRDSKLGDKIRIIPRQPDHESVHRIMCQTDCGVFPSRAEGWNLELLEMMGCGKQVICTNYSAHTEFCTKENSYLCPIDNLETAFDGLWFHGHGQWAEIGQNQKEFFIDAMRRIHVQKQSGTDIINNKGIETAKHFSWSNTAQEIIHGLQNT